MSDIYQYNASMLNIVTFMEVGFIEGLLYYFTLVLHNSISTKRTKSGLM